MQAVVFLGFGLVFLGKGLLLLWRGWATKEWPQTTGRVVYSGIENRLSSDDNGYKTVYRARIRYTYDVKGEPFSSEGVRYKDVETSLRAKIDQILREYPVGSEVEVFFNPGAPQESVLEPGVAAFDYIFLVVGFVITAIGLLQSLKDWLG